MGFFYIVTWSNPSEMINPPEREFLTLFENHMFHQFSEVIHRLAGLESGDKIFPWMTDLPEIPPAPLKL
jgi:hypothetical protein